MADEPPVDIDELLVNIKSTRNVNAIKEKLDRHQNKGATTQHQKDLRAAKKAVTHRGTKKRGPRTATEAELEEALETQRDERRTAKVLAAPLHRHARNRIESRVAYQQTKDELRPWDPIVEGLRVAEQLQFPHDERRDDPLRTQTAEERAKAHTPRTELEQRMAEALKDSKHAIRDDQQYSQAERELLKAMDVAQAKLKCEELRKMRALISFKAAKLKRQSKIKSKQFHRIRKRHERREIIKEVEQLLVKDPERADAKLVELEKDRAYERATLKHRGTNKWTKQVRKFASRDPQLRQRVEDQLRLGRELKGKHEAVGLLEDEDDAVNEMDEEEEKKLLSKTASELLGLGETSASANAGFQPAQLNPFYRSALENIRRERKARRPPSSTAPSTVDTSAQMERAVEEGNKEEDEPPPFLDLNVRPMLQLPKELVDGVDSDDSEAAQHVFQTEAYADDDVLGEFQRRKEHVETQERPKAKPSKYLRGWGAWTGPGISEETEKRREQRLFDQQPVKAQHRKDANRPGVIIREQCRVSDAVQRMQPRDVPFPFTRIQDYEAYIRQPLGRDWNTPIAHQQLTKPSILTKAGRIIRPLDKEVKKRRRLMLDIIGEE